MARAAGAHLAQRQPVGDTCCLMRAVASREGPAASGGWESLCMWVAIMPCPGVQHLLHITSIQCVLSRALHCRVAGGSPSSLSRPGMLCAPQQADWLAACERLGIFLWAGG